MTNCHVNVYRLRYADRAEYMIATCFQEVADASTYRLGLEAIECCGGAPVSAGAMRMVAYAAEKNSPPKGEMAEGVGT